MSFDPVPYHTCIITLIDKTTNDVTPISIDGVTKVGNLTSYRLSGMYVEPPNERTRYGQITLRVDDGLFVTKEPILTDHRTKNRFLIDVQLFNRVGNNPTGRAGTHFRFEISVPEDSVTKDGLALTLDLTGEEIRFDEHLDSTQHEKLTPRESFIDRVAHYSENRNGNAPLIFVGVPDDIDLPDSANLKQDWLPLSPTPTKKHLNEIINRISNPKKVGNTNLDYYYYFETDDIKTHSFKIHAKEFGSVDSGVILDSNLSDDSTQETDQTRTHDNTKFKKPLILRGKNGSHSIPMELTKHRSDLQHAYFADVWAENVNFNRDDYTKYNGKFYKCLINHTSSLAANSPSLNNGFWKNLSDCTTSSPWSNSVSFWESCMDGVGMDSDYVGFFHDCNIVKPNYDRVDESDEFENISIKDVQDYLTAPPSDVIHGDRYLVNNGVGTVWEGHNGTIAQYDESVSPAVWRFSKSPVSNDFVHNKKTAQVLRFDGNLWQTFWKLQNNYDTASTFHPVKSIELVADHNGVTARAIEFTYDWNVFDGTDISEKVLNLVENTSLPLTILKLLGHDLSNFVSSTVSAFLDFLGLSDNQDFIDTFGLGKKKNKASRWAGFVLPSKAFADGLLDCINLSRSINGAVHWNQGELSESLGRLRNYSIQIRVSFYNKAGELIHGLSEIPMVWAFRDLYDVTGYAESNLRVNGACEKVRIPVGPESNMQIHDSRIDELFRFLGYVIPWNFHIKKRELTGVKLDWKRIKEIQCFYRGSYDENLFYKGAQDAYLDSFTQHVEQSIKNLAWYTGGVIDMEGIVVDHVKVAISDVSFEKDAYVTSENDTVDNPREGYEILPDESDYYNLKAAAINESNRKQFDPQKHIITCRGDVRLQLGKRFSRRGKRILNGAEELVVQQVKHIETGNIYTCEVTGVKKYGD